MRLALLALLLLVTGNAAAQEHKIDVIDDPFRPHVQYESQGSSVQLNSNTTRIYVLTGLVDRKTRAARYVLQWGVVYRDREWRRFSGASLEGGEALTVSNNRRNVSSCNASARTCIYDEGFHITFTEAQMKKGATQGLTFKSFAGGTHDVITTVPAGLVAALLARMASAK